MASAIYWNDIFVTGGSSGKIYSWVGVTGCPTQAHFGSVDCLSIDLKGVLYSGCSKGLIVSWKLRGGTIVKDRILFEIDKFDKMDSGVLSMDFS